MSARKPFAFQVPGQFDRSAHLREHILDQASYWSDSRVLLLDEGLNARVGPNQPPPYIAGEQLDETERSNCVFLGMLDGRAQFAHVIAQTDPMMSGLDLRSAAAQWSATDSALFAQARALLHWHRQHKFCGVCGHIQSIRHAGYLLHCAGCGADSYPRTDAAIIVAVGHGDSLLLGRQAHWPENMWSVLAGFVEPAESFEAAARREVDEEVGLALDQIRYCASQPWPFPASLMVGFIAESEGTRIRCGEEISEARWFAKDQIQASLDNQTHDDSGNLLPRLSPPISISRWLIGQWLLSRSA